MKVISTEFDGLLILQPETYMDVRGFFKETYHYANYNNLGLAAHFVQDNISFSAKNVIRGMHYQIQNPFVQLVHVSQGVILDVVLDLRPKSSTYLQHFSIELSSSNNYQLYIPKGFAHGFCTVTSDAMVNYKCSGYYEKGDEGGVLHNSFGFDWPLNKPIISNKDKCLPLMSSLTLDLLPNYE